MENPKQRTKEQNRALYKFLTVLADKLNESGLDMRKVLKPTYNIPWTKDSTHDHIWIPFQKAMYNTDSTTKLSKHEQIDKIHETIMRELGEKHQLAYIPFPDIHDIGGFCGKKNCPKCNDIIRKESENQIEYPSEKSNPDAIPF